MKIKNRLWLTLVLILLAAPLVLLPAGCKSAPPLPADKAAIIDQLSLSEPNSALMEQIMGVLKEQGLEVDYFPGDAVTVDFYHKLDPARYKIIIFRSHSGLLGTEKKAIPRTCLFTNEAYSERQHLSEQLGDQLAMARIDADHPWVFAVGASYLEHSMKGKYPGSVVLMMGCSTLYINDLAGAFIDKGAIACIGWDASIGAEHMDQATLSLVQKICRDGLTFAKAVSETTSENEKDPNFGGALKCYPPKNSGLTLNEASTLKRD